MKNPWRIFQCTRGYIYFQIYKIMYTQSIIQYRYTSARIINAPPTYRWVWVRNVSNAWKNYGKFPAATRWKLHLNQNIDEEDIFHYHKECFESEIQLFVSTYNFHALHIFDIVCAVLTSSQKQIELCNKRHLTIVVKHPVTDSTHKTGCSNHTCSTTKWQKQNFYGFY